MYPVDQVNLIEDDMIEFFHYYIDLNKTYLKMLGNEEAFVEYLKANSKSIIKDVKSAKTSDEFYAIVNSIEQLFPYSKEIATFSTLQDKCEFLYSAMAMQNVKNLGQEVDTSRKAVLKRQRELETQYENLFPITKKYKDRVNNCKFIAGTMEDKNKLMTCYKADTTGISVNEFLNKIKDVYKEAFEDVKACRNECFKKLQAYYIGFYENLINQKNGEMQLQV